MTVKAISLAASLGNFIVLERQVQHLLEVYPSSIENNKYEEEWFVDAVMSDCPETVKVLKKYFPIENLDLANVIKIAKERGNCTIIRSLDPHFEDDIEKRKAEKRQEILENFDFGVLGIDVLPRSNEIDYCEKLHMITAMLPNDRITTTTVSYKDLLMLHMKPVHIENVCNRFCEQEEVCKNIINAVRIAEYIKTEAGVKDRLFKFLKKPAVIGSLRENSRLFSLDEVDVNLMLGDEVTQYLFFNGDDHKVEIRNLPSFHPLADYMNADNCFDLKKYVERYFTLVHGIMRSMEASWPAELADIRLDNFTTLYTPCLLCMDTEWTRTQAVRCFHHKRCPHLGSCQCRGYTTPSLTVSKIGELI